MSVKVVSGFGISVLCSLSNLLSSVTLRSKQWMVPKMLSGTVIAGQTMVLIHASPVPLIAPVCDRNCTPM